MNRTDDPVTPLCASHLGDLAHLEQLCFPDEPWSEKSLALLLDKTRAVARVVTDVETGKVIAYGGMTFAAGEGSVTNIAVHPDARRRGWGRAIVLTLLEEGQRLGLSEIYLEVRPSNIAALALYQNLGFCEVGRRKNFYRHPTEDALIMKATLPLSAS